MPKTKNKTKTSTARGIAAIVLAGAVLLAMIGLYFSRPEPMAEPSPLEENPYTAADFVYEDGYLTCTAGSTLLGIDVSSHQGRIDWEQVAASGVEFAFIRIGYRGYTQGSINADEFAAQNLEGAKAAGLKVGAYFYSQAISTAEAIQEAGFCIDFLKDYELDLPVVFDWEYVSASARTANMDKETLTECTLTFCQRMEKAGYEAMIYFNPDIATRLLELERLADYPFWLALYAEMNFDYRVDLWQYTQNGTVPGITGDVDINLWFTD